MWKFLLRRVGGMAATMLAVSVMVFLVMELPPGDYADRYAFRKFSGTGVQVSESDIQNIRVEFGLDRPIWERYSSWIWGIATRFDFGRSFAFETSVNDVIGDRLALTLALLYSTLLLTYLLSIPIGIYAAARQRSMADYGLTLFSYLGLALPNFMLALMLLYAGSAFLGISIGGLFSPEFRDAPWSGGKIANLLAHLAAPAGVLAWSATALQLQTVRATMLDEIGKLSVVAARARGLSERRVLLKYPARLALNPVVSTVGFDANRVFSELPIVALVLGLPELGELLIRSYLDLDMYVAGAVLLMLTFIIVFMNLLADVALAALDPRVKLRDG